MNPIYRDMTVHSEDALDAYARNRALGWETATNALAEIEPELPAFILAISWKTADRLNAYGVAPEVTEMIEREIGLLAIACVDAQRPRRRACGMISFLEMKMPDRPSHIFDQRSNGSVCVELRTENAMSLQPGWTETDPADFLRACAVHLAATMLNAGVVELARLIRVGEELIAREGSSHAK